jgi:hypothetical protein
MLSLPARLGCCAAGLLLGAGQALAQPADPLQSPACKQALAALQAAEEKLPAKQGDGAESARRNLLPWQQAAARACLGAAADPERPPGAARLVLPNPVLPTRPALTVPAQRAMPPPAPRPAPLLSITSCDALGCWASDGTRLQRLGGALLGPQGFCSAHGTVLNCPAR